MTAPEPASSPMTTAVEAAAIAWYCEIDSHHLDGRSGGWEAEDEVGREMYRQIARVHLAAALPLLRLSDVPGLERQLRDKIAGEAQAKLDAMIANDPGGAPEAAFDGGWRACVSWIAEGSESSS